MDELEALVSQWKQSQDNLVLQHSDLALSTLAGMVGSGTIDVAPGFQRRDRWSPLKQSSLIESFFLNLPIPPVYLAEEDGGTYSVIDGRQRLTAIRLFFEGDLVLGGLEELPRLNGLRYAELPPVLQSALAMRPLRSATLLRQTDAELKYLVFHRLNTAGEPLNPQEIRNVVHRGPLNDLLHALAENPYLRKQLKIENEDSAAYRKMQDVEFVLRYLTLAEVWQRFSGDLARSMDDFMEKNQKSQHSTLDSLSESFTRSLSICERLWGPLAFRRPEGTVWRAQALAGLYDAQMISASLLEDAQVERLASQPDAILSLTKRLFKDKDFETAVRTGTNTPSRVKVRIEQLASSLKALADNEI
ncbi:DUF262 domain-containing protein [Arthrobacter sp. zg-Y895]|uniref:DUF262 domain-containing protein n=1 Tax=Arthrobacter sp. zg-Y895 TaxID=2886933 RepID=UPI001D13BC36|nr:DUF262 domain-containing protein [Arthrobacter sp. zg-Y895]MCC3301640.1 DUF262 domain-containing protein [Arthrobacter sp. zg-Y895]